MESVTTLLSLLVDRCPHLGPPDLRSITPLPLPLIHRARHAHLAGDRAGQKERRRRLKALGDHARALDTEAGWAQQHGGSGHPLRKPLALQADLGAMEDRWQRRRKEKEVLMQQQQPDFDRMDSFDQADEEAMFPAYEE